MQFASLLEREGVSVLISWIMIFADRSSVATRPMLLPRYLGSSEGHKDLCVTTVIHLLPVNQTKLNISWADPVPSPV